MANNNYTDQVYKKSRELFTTQKFEGEWQKFIHEKINVDSLLSATGPSTAYADALDKLRSKINETVKDATKSGSGLDSAEKVLIAAAKPGDPQNKWAERAAALKMLKHFYRHSQRGAQDVWIYSPPKDYTKWIFDEIKGTDTVISAKLQKEEEVYTEGDKKTMGDALQIALACSQKTEKLLAEGKPETVAIVKRWFADGNTSEDQTKTDVATLLSGFKKISNLCNSNTLVFPDDPNDRKSATKYEKLYGSVWPGGEGSFSVIYLAGAFKKAGNSGRLWLCAQTIIHEASHLEVSTEDHQYDTEGLKPGTGFPHSQAIDNADSWGYFCIDLCGYLSQSDRDQVLK